MSQSQSLKRRESFKRARARRPSFLDHADWMVEKKKEGTDVEKAVASYWERLLSNKETHKEKDTSEGFFAEIHSRLLNKYPTVTQGFREMDTSGDGMINFFEWDGMLHMLNLPLQSRACHWVFKVASKGQKELSLTDLRELMMMPSIKKWKGLARSYQRRQDRVNGAVQTFITQLTNGSRRTRVSAVDRFQRKMTLPFCRELFAKVTVLDAVKDQRERRSIQDVTVDRMAFHELLSRSIGSSEDGGLLLEFQAAILMNIAARVGNYRGNTMSLVDLMSSITILSSDTDRCGKLKLMFEVFDTDEDTVLEDHQLKELFCRICKMRPLFQGSSLMKQEGGVAFQEELSSQEGLRDFECVKWRLQRWGNQESSVNWSELWATIKDQPDVICSLIPAPPRLHWTLDPIAVQIADSLPRTTTPRRGQRQVAEVLLCHPYLDTGDAEEKARGSKQQVGRRDKYLSPLDPGYRPTSRERPGSREKPPSRDCMRPGSRDCVRPNSREKPPSCPPSRDGMRPGSREKPPSRDCRRPGSRQQGVLLSKGLPPSDPSLWIDRQRPQTSEFRKDLTNGFQTRLRRLGQQRMFELKEGFENPGFLSSPRSSMMNDGSDELSDISKAAPPGAPRKSMLPRMSSTGSLRGTRLHSAGQRSSVSAGSGSLSRVSTAPLGLRPGSVSGPLEMCPEDDAGSTRTSKDRLPAVESLQEQHFVLKWGAEGFDRHALRISAPGSCSVDVGLIDNFGFKCQLCGRIHELNPKKQGEGVCEEGEEGDEY